MRTTETHIVPNDRRDDKSGRFTEKYPKEAFLNAIDNLGGAAGTQEIADQVGSNYNTTYSKLQKLEDEGEVESRKVANAHLWSVAE